MLLKLKFKGDRNHFVSLCLSGVFKNVLKYKLMKYRICIKMIKSQHESKRLIHMYLHDILRKYCKKERSGIL